MSTEGLIAHARSRVATFDAAEPTDWRIRSGVGGWVNLAARLTDELEKTTADFENLRKQIDEWTRAGQERRDHSRTEMRHHRELVADLRTMTVCGDEEWVHVHGESCSTPDCAACWAGEIRDLLDRNGFPAVAAGVDGAT